MYVAEQKKNPIQQNISRLKTTCTETLADTTTRTLDTIRRTQHTNTTAISELREKRLLITSFHYQSKSLLPVHTNLLAHNTFQWPHSHTDHLQCFLWPKRWWREPALPTKDVESPIHHPWYSHLYTILGNTHELDNSMQVTIATRA